MRRALPPFASFATFAAAATAAAAAALIAACSSSSSGTRSDGAGGATSTSSSTTSSTSVSSSSTGGTGGTTSTCDDVGACGTPDDPACIGCATHEGSCVDEAKACEPVPCTELETCYDDCKSTMGGDPCFQACDMKYPEAVPAYDALAICVLCVECPVSCATDLTQCPK